MTLSINILVVQYSMNYTILKETTKIASKKTRDTLKQAGRGQNFGSTVSQLPTQIGQDGKRLESCNLGSGLGNQGAQVTVKSRGEHT